MVQPPLRGSSKRPDALGLLVQDVDDRQGQPERGCFGKRGVVIKPKVVAEPDDGSLSGRSHATTLHTGRDR